MTSSLVGKIFASLDKADNDDEAKAACVAVLDSHLPRPEHTQHLTLHPSHRKEHPALRNPFKTLQTLVRNKHDIVATAELFSVVATHLSGDDVLSFPQWDAVLSLVAQPTDEFLRFACGKCFPCASLPQAVMIASLVLDCVPVDPANLSSNANLKWVCCLWRMLWGMVPLWAAASQDELQQIFQLQCTFTKRFGAVVGEGAMMALESHMAQSIHYRAIVMAASGSSQVRERPESARSVPQKRFPFVLSDDEQRAKGVPSSSVVQAAVDALMGSLRPVATTLCWSESDVASYDSHCHIRRAMATGRSDGLPTAIHLMMLLEDQCPLMMGKELQLLDRNQMSKWGDKLLVDTFDQGHRVRWAVPGNDDSLDQAQITFADACQWWKEERSATLDLDKVLIGDNCAMLLAQKIRGALRLERKQDMHAQAEQSLLEASRQDSEHCREFLLRHLLGAQESPRMSKYVAHLLGKLGPVVVRDSTLGEPTSLPLYASMLAAWLFADEDNNEDVDEAVWFVLRVVRHTDLSTVKMCEEQFHRMFVKTQVGLGYEQSHCEATATFLAKGLLSSFWWNVQPVVGLWLLLWRERCGETLFAEFLAAHWAHRLHALSVEWDGPILVSPTYWSRSSAELGGGYMYAPSVLALVCSPVDVSLLNSLIDTL